MSLPEPYYHDEEAGITIYHGDCREILPHLPKVDLVLTDPPYGLDRTDPVRQPRGTMLWDSSPPDKAIFDQLIAMSGDQIIWGGNYFPLPPRKGFFVWDKVQPENFSLAMCEMAWSSIDKPAKIFRYSVRLYADRVHPTEKPEALMSWCIGHCRSAQTILDPFAGSCTTAVAAKNLGRKCICIEREEKYCEVGVNRLRQEVLKL